MHPVRDRAQTLASGGALLLILLAPLLLLGPCLFGPRLFVPFDLAQFPPVSTLLTPEQLRAVTAAQNTDISEVPFTFVPELRFTQQELAAGRLPHWNPYARGGAPLLATSVVGLLYPLNWVCLVLGDPQHGLALVAYLGFLIAGVLTYRLLRRLHLSPTTALFGALAFMLSGTLCANAHFYQRFHALAWLPGMLWGVLRTAQGQGHGRVPGIVALALSMTMTWLAGFPPYAAGASMLAGLYGLACCVRELRSAGARAALRLAGALAAAATLGLAAASAQLVPMFAFFPHASRTIAPGVDSLSTQTFDLSGLLGYVLPSPFGHPTKTSALPYEGSPLAWALFDQRSLVSGQPVLPRYNFTEFTVFPGTLTLLLAFAGVLSRGLRIKTFLAGSFLLLLLLALGPRWLTWLYALPGIQNVPPVRYVGPLCLLLALLAALGLEYAPRGLSARARSALWIVAALGGLLCLAGRALLGARSANELFDAWAPAIVAHYGHLPSASIDTLRQIIGAYLEAGRAQLLGNLAYGGIALLLGAAWFAALPWAAATRARLLGFRSLAIAATVGELLVFGAGISSGRELPHAHTTAVHDFLRAQRDQHARTGGFTVARAAKAPVLPLALPPCSLVPERIRDLNAYTFLDANSHRPWLALYGPGGMFREYYVNSLPDDERLAHPLLDLCGVRFLLADAALEHAGRRVGPQLRGPGGEFYVYERAQPLPRAFVVPHLRVLPDDERVIAALVDPGLQPRAAALVTPDQAELASAHPGGPDAPRRTAVFRRDDPGQIVVQVPPGDPGFLVFNDTWMPGWSATVNDAPLPLLRANISMRAVPLPAHGAEVRLRYTPPGFAVGIRITLAALLVLALLCLSFVTSRHRGEPADNPT
jgi:hypothetical protein